MESADSILYGKILPEMPLSYAEVEAKLILLSKKIRSRQKEELPEEMLFETGTFAILRGFAKKGQRRPVLVLSDYFDYDHLVPEIAGEKWDCSEIFLQDQSNLNLREVLEEGRSEYQNFTFTLQIISDRADELLHQLS